MTVSATLKSLSARNLGEIEVPVPSPRELDLVARLVEASEAAYNSAVEAARLRREALRDAVIHEIGRRVVAVPVHARPCGTPAAHHAWLRPVTRQHPPAQKAAMPISQSLIAILPVPESSPCGTATPRPCSPPD